VTDFDFSWDPTYRRVARLFGITPERTAVTLAAGTFSVRYGPWRLETTAANVADVRIEGPYAFFKTAGPPHLGITDRGITFASNGERGVRLELRDPVPGIEPTGRLRHPNVTVTVADPEGLLTALRQARRPLHSVGSD
jgi:hypothetical protein